MMIIIQSFFFYGPVVVKHYLQFAKPTFYTPPLFYSFPLPFFPLLAALKFFDHFSKCISMFICFVVVTQKRAFFSAEISKLLCRLVLFYRYSLFGFYFFSFLFICSKRKKVLLFLVILHYFLFLAFKFVFSFFSLVLSSSAGCGYFKLFVFRVLNLHKKFKYELGKP